MTTSIPTKSPDLNVASSAGSGSAASFFGGDACSAGASTDFAALLAGDASGTATDAAVGAATASNAATNSAASVLASAVVAPALAVTDAEPETVTSAPSRDTIEQAAALIASLWNVLQPQTTPPQVAPPAEAETNAAALTPDGANTASVASSDVKITLQWGNQAPAVLNLPAGAQPPADLAQEIGEQFSAALDQNPASDLNQVENATNVAAATESTDGISVPHSASKPAPELTISLEVAGSTVASVQVDASAAKPTPRVAVAGTEKFAGKIRLPDHASQSARAAFEKNFLSAEDDMVTESEESNGIGVAESQPTMPAFFATRQITSERFESAAHSWISDSVGTQHTAETAVTPESTTAASLARKAVDTIQNVIETQHIRTDHMGVVSLNFKFGTDDLAVRVQLRNGEVHTQFRTDSSDLRSALSDEWHALVVGQGADAGQRLIEPVFAPSNSSLSQQHSGSNSNQQFAQKQQQEAQAPFAMPEVRTFRKGLNAATAAAAEIAPQIARSLPTSLHLTAFA